MRVWKVIRAVLVAPVMVTIVAPALIWLLGGLRSFPAGPVGDGLLLALDGVVAACGVAFVAWTVALFDRVGSGTLVPWDPPGRLVVRGPTGTSGTR